MRISLHRGLAGVLALGLISLTAAAGSLPALAQPTSSAKTVRASDYDPDAENAPFPKLAVTVSQTDDLISQGVTVSWTGAALSTVPNQATGGSNFLQIMQCWGDEPGSNGTRPDRTTCVYGGFGLPGARRWTDRETDSTIAAQDEQYTAAGSDWYEPTQTAIPFVSATGSVVESIKDGKRIDGAADIDSNEFFTKYTTNEISWAGSGADGSGSVHFELHTVQQSPGLGCGTPVKAADGTRTGTSCWLVVIPRGEADPGGTAITESGLLWDNWSHHLAVRLNFKPSGLSCAMGSAERQLSGSELISGAVSQWQPALCSTKGGSVYSLLTGPESDAALAANGTASSPLALTSRALAAEDVTDSLAYAPVALTGVSIAFAIDRQARVTGEEVSDEIKAKERQAFTSMKLTPRLLAKLLTASYTDALPDGSDESHLSGVRNLTQDPEFLAINDKEWASMHIVGAGVGDLLVPLGRSDAARTVWEYIMSDPDAADFLNGVPDDWGMTVNPYYSTNERVNPTGVGLELPRDDFPKADPVEFKGTERYGYLDSVDLVTWRPYTASLEDGAYLTLRGDAKTLGVWDESAVPQKYTKGARAQVGLQAVLGLTDTAAGARYQVVQASLLNAAGNWVAPSDTTMTAAAKAMTAEKTQTQVLRLDPTSDEAKAAKQAYPLTMPVYAAVNPAMSDAELRASYASFIEYAAESGQTPGTDDGELAEGYAPLPASWVKQAKAAANAIRSGGWPSAATASPSSSASASPTPTPSATTTRTSTEPVPSAPVAATQPSATATSPSPQPTPTSASATPAATRVRTPDDPGIGGLSAVIPVTAALGVAAMLGIPLTSRLGRRRR